MKTYIRNFLLLSVFTAFIGGSCTDKFEEINTDPDRAKDAPATNVLAYALTYYSDNMFDVWNNMNEPSTYAGYLAKIQYIDEARYVFRPGVVETRWYVTYITLNNLKEVEKKAIADNAKNLLGVVKVLQAFVVQMATDNWRDIPYSDALRLSEGKLLPAYDKQEDIYPALLTLLKDAADLMNEGSIDQLGAGDLMFNGDMNKWRKFANSLRLRLAMRISGVSTTLAKSTVESILANPSAYPVMTSNADNAFFWWPGTSPYQEPSYEDSNGRDDHGMSDVLINALKNLSDPRLSVYAKPATADNEYRGFVIGATAQPSLPTISRIGARFRNDPEGFSPYMRCAEVYFHIAEAAQLGWTTGTTAAAAYNAGVTASMIENGVSDANIATYLAGPGAFNNTLATIYMQEWLAMFKQGMEGWSLFRRTGVPTTHYVAPGSPYTGHNTPPFRYPYPQNELTLNGTNSTPYVNEVVDDFWGKKMWWDTRTGVQ